VVIVKIIRFWLFASFLLLLFSGHILSLSLCKITYDVSPERTSVIAKIHLPDENLNYRISSSSTAVIFQLPDYQGIIVSDKDKVEGFIEEVSLFEGGGTGNIRGVTLKLEDSLLSLIEKHGSSIEIKLVKTSDFSGMQNLPFFTEQKYIIGIDDKLSFSVYGNPDLSSTFQVGKDGKVNLSLVGDIQAAGLTVSQLTNQVTQFLAKDFIVDPQVSIEVVEYNSQWAYVTGQVRNQMRVALKGNTTLKDAIAAAGGLFYDAGQDIIISRKKESSQESEQIKISRADFEEGIANALLLNGDVITVPKAKYAYIQGEVRRPSEIILVKGITLLKSISIAQGLTDWADDTVIILRESSSGQVALKYNLKKIREGKAPDVILMPEDVVIVKKRFL
jgi:polysaccharide export outer membrane protein